MLEEEKLRPQLMSPYREPLVSVLVKFPDTASAVILNHAAGPKGSVYMVWSLFCISLSLGPLIVCLCVRRSCSCTRFGIRMQSHCVPSSCLTWSSSSHRSSKWQRHACSLFFRNIAALHFSYPVCVSVCVSVSQPDVDIPRLQRDGVAVVAALVRSHPEWLPANPQILACLQTTWTDIVRCILSCVDVLLLLLTSFVGVETFAAAGYAGAGAAARHAAGCQVPCVVCAGENHRLRRRVRAV